MKPSNVYTLPLRRWKFAMMRQCGDGNRQVVRSGRFRHPCRRFRNDAFLRGNQISSGTPYVPDLCVTEGRNFRHNTSSVVGVLQKDLRKWRSLDSEGRPISGQKNVTDTESDWRSRGQCGTASASSPVWRVMSFNILADSLVDNKYDILVRL